MSSLHSLKDGQDPVVADSVEETEWKWWLESSGPPSHSYIQRPGQYSGWELMTSKKWRQVTKSLPGLWRDAYVQRGKNVTVTEVISDDGYTVYTVIVEDGDRYVRCRNMPGYAAKSAIFDELLGIEDYQGYTTIVCQATPIWDTVIRLCRAKGVKVVRVTDGWTFES